MFMKSKPTLTLLVAAVAVALVWGTLSHSAPPPGKGGGGKTVPGGPGLIAFNDFNAGRLITLINPDGTGSTLVAATEFNAKPAWSPVFSDGTLKLAWGDGDSNGAQFLTVVDVSPTLGEAVRIAGSDALITEGTIFNLDWSAPVGLPDGTESVRVAFMNTKFSDGGSRFVIMIVNLIYDPGTGMGDGIFIVDPDGETVVLDPGPGLNNAFPRFSPDGTLLTLQRASGSPTVTAREIWLADSDGENQRVLIDGPGSFDESAAWSPDGLKLAFVSDRVEGRPNIFVASLIADEWGDLIVESIEPVTDKKNKANARWSGLSWSPDGTQITYVDHGKGTLGFLKSLEIRKVIVATGKDFKLADGFGPDWSPIDLLPLP